MLIDADAFQRVLGEELRKLRRQRGWTRKELNERLQSEISLQTLATYELGTRHCSVVRLVELCMALGEPPQDLLGRVHRRVFGNGEDPGQVRVNLAVVVADDSPGLSPLRRWAEDRLKRSNSPEIQLDRSALERMAELCRMPTAQLLAKLAELSSSSGAVVGERTDTDGRT